jgi:hypothetical protein
MRPCLIETGWSVCAQNLFKREDGTMSTTYQVKFPGVLRFPRHRESYKLKLWKAEQLATLKAKVWERIRVGQDLAKRGRKANIEIGRALNELKSRVGHGHWKDFYVTNFGSSGIAERTARTWMKMARREPNAISKTAESAVLPKPMAPNAKAICDANEKAEAKAKEDYDREKGKLQLDAMFKNLTRQLVKSPDWLNAQREIFTALKALCTKFGIANTDVLERENTEGAKTNENPAA